MIHYRQGIPHRLQTIAIPLIRRAESFYFIILVTMRKERSGRVTDYVKSGIKLL
jgi:hypothetical protein